MGNSVIRRRLHHIRFDLSKMLGHSDLGLIPRIYDAQNEDTRMVAEACKIDLGLNLPKIVEQTDFPARTESGSSSVQEIHSLTKGHLRESAPRVR